MVDGVAPDYPSFSSSSTSTDAPISYSSTIYGGRRERTPWTEEEHALLLLGVELYGERKWTDISEYSEMTKTHVQLRSHFQKYNDHQKNQTEIEGKNKERTLHLTLPDFDLDYLQHLISSRPRWKDRLKDEDCPFPFHSVLMNELRERIHDTPPPPIPQPPTEIPESEGAEKKGTEDKGESSSSCRDQQDN